MGVILYGYYHGPGVVPILGISLGSTAIKILVAIAALLLPTTLLHLKTLFWEMDSDGNLRRNTYLFSFAKSFGYLKNDKVRLCPSYWTLGAVLAVLGIIVYGLCLLSLAAFSVVASDKFSEGVVLRLGQVLIFLKYAVPIVLYVVVVFFALFKVMDISTSPSGRYREFSNLVVVSGTVPLFVILFLWPLGCAFSTVTAPYYPGGFWAAIHDNWQVVLAGAVLWSVSCYLAYVLWLGLTTIATWGWSALTEGPVGKIAIAAYNRLCVEIPVAPALEVPEKHSKK